MTISEYTTLASNIVILVFLIWSYFRRKNIDDRIDKLANILTSVTDILDKNRSWEKSATEVKALEELYDRKTKAEVDNYSKENLQASKNIALQSVTLIDESIKATAAIKLFVPTELKSLIYAQMLRAGESADQGHVKMFYTSKKEIDEAIIMLAKQSVGSSNESPKS